MPDTQPELFDPSLTHPLPPRRGPRRGRGRGRRNELLEVVRLALVVARRHLNDYSCPKSKHTYTQPQLLACLVLRAFKRLTYRGTTELLEASDGLREVLGLSRVPAHTTLKAFCDRAVTPALLDGLAGEVLALLRERGLVVGELAVDSTGMEPTCASAHFLSRAGRRRRGYVKLSLAVACTSIVLVSVALSMGPSNDLCEAAAVMWPAAARCSPDWAFKDSGYDGEWVHSFWAAAGATSHVPPVPRAKDEATGEPTVKSGPGRLRCWESRPYHYGRRWHAESFVSGMKRTCGSTLSAKSEPALLAEAGLKALAYAIRR
jgi:hypothetical protein